MLSAADDWQAVEVAKSHSSEKIDTSVPWKEPVSRDADEVIAEGNGSAQSGQDGVIKQVVGTERRADDIRDPEDIMEAEEQDGQGMKEKELQDASDSELEPKDGSGVENAENSIAGTHATGNLNSSSLEKVKFIREEQFIAWQERSISCHF